MNQYLKNGNEARLGKTRKTNMNAKPEEFVAEAYSNSAQAYGHRIANFLIFWTKLLISPPADDRGDAYVNSKTHYFSLLYEKFIETISRIYFEIKVSYLDTRCDTYAITRIRPKQNINYYIICLIDPDNNFESHYFCLPKSYIEESDDFKRSPMTGNKISNVNNNHIELRFTIKKEDAYEKFGKHTTLKGTSFYDLKEYIDYTSCDEFSTDTVETKPTKVKSTNKMTVNPVSDIFRHNMKHKFAFEVDGRIINGKTNQNTILNFVNQIGAVHATNFFSPNYLSTVYSKWRSIYVGSGYYLNTQISYRDVQLAVKRGSKKKSGYEVKLIDLD